jgi:hypothetical protein
MASNATKAGALALSLAMVVGLGGCGNDPAGQTSPESGGVTGELSVVSVLGSTDGHGLLYLLKPADGSASVELRFDSDPALTAGTTLRVWGTAEGTGLRVARYEVLAPTGTGASLIAAATPTSQTVAWVQIDINGGGVNQTAAQASALIFDQNAGPIFGTKSGNLSVVQYYAQASYGLLQLSGDVVGPVPYSGTACNNLDAVAQAVVPEVTALGKTYNHYYLYWGSEQSCGPGWGAEGTHSKPQADVWLNNDGTFCTATGQELGHNFGLMHASTMDCGTSTLTDDTSTCTSSEYGNPMTVMGGGCRDFDAIEKWYSQWLSGCNGARINQSGTYTLFPLETACGGIQALQIPFPAGAAVRTTTTDQSNGAVTLKDYYLELRSSVGVDTGLKGGVYVYVAPEIPAATKTGPRTFLLDMNPSTTAFDPMTAGQTFTDPAGGVSFTVNSFDATQASITVTITGGTGANTCIDGSTLSGSGPTSCAASSTGSGGAGGAGGGTGGAGGAGGKGTGVGGAGAGGHAGSPGAGGAAAGSSGTMGTGGAKGGSSGATGTGGAGGATGSGGSGTGGASGGTTGSGGATSPGTGGASGGSTGNGGATGSGGTPGTGGAKGGATGSGGGSGGATGSGGSGSGGASGGSTGNGGTTGNGSGGATGGSSGTTGSGGGPGQEGGGASSGCSCELGGPGAGRWPQSSGLAFLFGLGALAVRPRRAARRRRSPAPWPARE